MSAVDQVHMALIAGGVEVTVRRGRAVRTLTCEGWGPALAFINYETAINQRPDPTPPPAGILEARAA